MQNFSYDFVILNRQGQVVERHSGMAEEWVEELGDGLNLELVYVKGGTFQMGTQQGLGYPDETPRHLVSLMPFYIGRYLVTQAQWKAIMGRLPDCRFKGPQLPLMNISGEGAAEFCRRLAKKTGKPYCLPSEAQWEYACRAGTSTPFSTGETLTTDYANFVGQPPYREEPVGIYRHVVTPGDTFLPNPFGISDMHGNLWEWCADQWHAEYTGAPFDGGAWDRGGEAGYGVARGGSWHEPALNCRSATRLRARLKDDDEFYGFRVALLSA
jgi:formylglycine-generating enzyme required for sulfatase activity